MLKRFFTAYLLGLIIFGALFFGLSTKLSGSVNFRPMPIELEGVSLEEITP